LNTMDITLSSKLDAGQQLLILGQFEDDTSLGGSYDPQLALELKKASLSRQFSSQFGEVYLTKMPSLPFTMVAVLGLGQKKEMNLDRLRRILGIALQSARSLKLKTIATNLIELIAPLLRLDLTKVGMAAAEALYLSEYAFTKYLSEERKQKYVPIESVSIQWSSAVVRLQEGIQQGKIIAQSTNYVRDLVNEPASVVTPERLEQEARNLASGNPLLTVKVLEADELKNLGLNALLGVAQGSRHFAKLILLEYRGSRKEKYTALVGKGITFDSGGYNLKATHSIEDMKFDMAGAAAVLGTIKVAAELGIHKNIVGVIPTGENMIGSQAQHPGDIVRAFNGKTIEITNTDAEGRLILADALSYTEAAYHPEVMIDIATLTGAIVVALGYYAAGLFSPDKQLISELVQAGEESHDRVWPMPFFEEYLNWMDGTISDLRNTTSRGEGKENGAVNGAVFLSKFVEKARWAHLDIAGSAYWKEEGDYLTTGATGSGVRVLSYYLLDQTKNKGE